MTERKTKRNLNKRAKVLSDAKMENGKILLESLSAPSYEEIMKEIEAKIGKRPKLPRDLPKGEWGEQAIKVLEERYLVKNEEMEVIETPEEMLWRVAWEIASAEARWGKNRKGVLDQAEEFYQLMASRKFLPNSPTLMNAGTGNMLQYSACFVLPVEDSMEGIFDALKYQALIHKTGGGTGFSFSRLRPKGFVVKTSKGIASGPVSFMRIFDAATNEVKQGGKRRGANMGILRVDHPDIKEFIHCKEDGGITNFNISVAITNKFMEAFEKGEDYDLIDPKSGEKVGKLNAREVFDEIADAAWRTGDPGLIFIDKINESKANPVPPLGPIESTNPCGEQPLYPFDACNLGSIFLGYFVKDKKIEWDELEKVVKMAVRFLDNVIEVNPYPLEQIRKMVFNTRRIGLGVGGWADMLIKLGIPYDSEEGVRLAKEVMNFIETKAVEASIDLASERGPFPLWSLSIYKDEEPRRNSTVTTIAPTGTISIIAGASSGIEPLFAIAYQHIVKDKHLDRRLSFINPFFEEMLKEKGIWSQELVDRVIEKGMVRDMEELPEDIKNVFGTAHEINPEWHIRMQAAFQESTENAVSKTINLRHEATVEDVKKAYLLAWNSNCRGITVFRDGSKDAQVLNVGLDKKEEDKKEIWDEKAAIIERPFVAKGATYKLATPVGTAFVTINEDENGQPLEVFINVGKAGSDLTAVAEALGRVISTALRSRGNTSPKDRALEIAHQLSGIGGRRSVGFGPSKIRSLPDAVAAAISIHFGFRVNGFLNHDVESDNHHVNGLANGVKKEQELVLGSLEKKAELEFKQQALLLEEKGPLADICPSCGSNSFVYEEGCSKCYVCGYSEC
ncbi:MAG: Ribonucleotide reductase of class II (coenzyme B12-dependent) [Candidatus Woesebacteria bacterium]|nr:MAG: Ribonucleotide reductase of class II (coenzyme B12-dependent) [Candidatus Woesebacteria bacterium]